MISVQWFEKERWKKFAGKEVPDGQVPGLYCRVSPKGKFSFRVRLNLNGAKVYHKVGVYPQTKLADIRTEAERCRELAAKGVDPRLSEEQKRPFKEAFEKWWALKQKGRISSADNMLADVTNHIIPEVGGIASREIDKWMWYEVFEDIAVKYPSVVSRLISHTRQFYEYARDKQWVPEYYDPLQDITAKKFVDNPFKHSGHPLEDDELAYVWQAASRPRLMEHTKIFTELCILLGNRNHELREAHMTDFDFENDLWIIPPERHKAGRQGKTKLSIIRPLHPEVKKRIQRLIELSPDPVLLMPGRYKGGEAVPLRQNWHITKGIREHLATKYGIDIPKLGMHDFRRTLATSGATFIPDKIRKMLQGHLVAGIEGRYNQNKYVPDMREAYDAWVEYVFDAVKRHPLPTPVPKQ